MKTKFIAFFTGLLMVAGCVSKSKYTSLNTEQSRLKNDSLLLEKRIRQLNDENNRLATYSAQMEQALNNRLKEKQDSLNYKEQLLLERELSIKDMKARKEEEQEAFETLGRQIVGDFSDYNKQSVVTTIGCTQISVMLNEKEINAGNSWSDIQAKTLAVLNKYPDVNLIIISYTDSVPAIGKDKNTDPAMSSFIKSHHLCKALILQNKSLNNRLYTGVKNESYPKYFSHQTELVFYSHLIPCIYTK